MNTLECVLARAFTEIVIKLDLSVDDAIAPEATTMQLPDPVIALLQALPAQGPASPRRTDQSVRAGGSRLRVAGDGLGNT
ncbi:hypothetical protein ACWDRB_21105 [Nonomuraea sp. NPDC003707]